MSGLRIGVLGASRIAELAIISPAATLGHRVVAVAARDRGRAETFARSYEVERVVDTYADLVADPEVDVVYNPLANAFHAPWTLAAIEAGAQVHHRGQGRRFRCGVHHPQSAPCAHGR